MPSLQAMTIVCTWSRTIALRHKHKKNSTQRNVIPEAREPGHWGTWITKTGWMYEGPSVDNHFDKDHISGVYRLTTPGGEVQCERDAYPCRSDALNARLASVYKRRAVPLYCHKLFLNTLLDEWKKSSAILYTSVTKSSAVACVGTTLFDVFIAMLESPAQRLLRSVCLCPTLGPCYLTNGNTSAVPCSTCGIVKPMSYPLLSSSFQHVSTHSLFRH